MYLRNELNKLVNKIAEINAIRDLVVARELDAENIEYLYYLNLAIETALDDIESIRKAINYTE